MRGNSNSLPLEAEGRNVDADFAQSSARGNPSEIDDSTLLQAFVLLARFHGIAVDAGQLTHNLAITAAQFRETEFLRASKEVGLKSQVVRQAFDRLDRVALPAVALRSGGGAFVIARIGKGRALIHEVDGAGARIISEGELAVRYEGRLILVASRASLLGNLAKFDLTWFIPAVVKYRKILTEVLVGSLFLQLFALVTPLFFQIVMDKVLVHNAITTLTVVSIALVGITIFNVVLSGMRSYVFSHTTSRLDVELGAKLFRQIMRLPVAYFEARRVGDTVARVRELDNVRNFLTGQALTSILDMIFSVVFLGVMLTYSVKLTVVVLVSLPLYAALSMSISPELRRRVNEKFARGADNQAFLVEAVSGIGTVKSLALGPRMTKLWDQQLSAYVAASFRVGNLANWGQQGIQLVQKLVTVAILYWGAQAVIAGKLSVGQLIAFNMLAGQVAAPILRLAQLWQDFQQVGVSIERLGDVLNSPGEPTSSSETLPPIRGDIRLDDVSFRYQPYMPRVLEKVSIDIAAGEVIGIVGRSGSGKSTITKLMQRLYVPESGRISIDGHDIALADPNWLRRQLGVVLQDNFLFNRTIRENISLVDPGMAMERVVNAAKLAGAHEFISELPQGYDTEVGEHGSTLSGGQRQRIAIARALVTNPRILILDEATSALDYESEQAIMANMRDICKDRTVVIIAHRLATVRYADRIIVLDRGSVVEQGDPTELLATTSSRFSQLYALQQVWK